MSIVSFYNSTIVSSSLILTHDKRYLKCQILVLQMATLDIHLKTKKNYDL